MFRWSIRFYFFLLVGAGLGVALTWKSPQFAAQGTSETAKSDLRTLADTNTVHDKSPSASQEKLNLIYDYLLGEYFQNKNDPRKALKALEKAVKKDPNSAHLQLSLAETYLKLGQVQEGVKASQKALEFDPDNRDAILMMVNLNVTAKKYGSARDLLERLIKKNPLDEEAVLLHVLVDVEDQNLVRAHKNLKEYLKRDSSSANGFFYLGRLEQSVGKKEKAIEAFEKSMELRPSFVQSATYLALLYEDSGQKEKALALYRWLADETDETSFHKKLGNYYLENKDYDRALGALQRVELREPDDLNNVVKVALILIEQKKLKEASQKLRKVLAQAPDSDNIRFYLAALYEQQEDYKSALEHYKKVPESSKLHNEAIKGTLYSLKKLGREKDAAAALRKLLANTPPGQGNREQLFEMGIQVLTHQSKDTSVAESLLSEGLESFPKSTGLLYLKGSMLEKAGKTEEAFSLMEKILKKDANHVGALNFVGYILADRNQDLVKAERLIRRAHKLRPNDPFILDSLGWLLFRQGKSEEAKKTLTLALSMKPDESIIADHLGDVLVKLGALDEAREYYEKAIKLGPDKDSDRQKLEAKLASLKEKLTICQKRGLALAECSSRLHEPRAPSASP
jgi:tetratricopeptide (TPR) repeat protein